jgi:hypothetical protein
LFERAGAGHRGVAGARAQFIGDPLARQHRLDSRQPPRDQTTPPSTRAGMQVSIHLEHHRDAHHNVRPCFAIQLL